MLANVTPTVLAVKIFARFAATSSEASACCKPNALYDRLPATCGILVVIIVVDEFLPVVLWGLGGVGFG